MLSVLEAVNVSSAEFDRMFTEFELSRGRMSRQRYLLSCRQ